MTISELIEALQMINSGNEVFVCLFKADDTGEMFEIDAICDNNGYAQLEISEDKSEETLNDVGKLEEDPLTTESTQAVVDAFQDLCARRGITTEEKDLIWNAMAAVCYEQVRKRQGSFYESIKPLFTERPEN